MLKEPNYTTEYINYFKDKEKTDQAKVEFGKYFQKLKAKYDMACDHCKGDFTADGEGLVEAIKSADPNSVALYITILRNQIALLEDELDEMYCGDD